MSSNSFGIEGFSDDDRTYSGSRFADVRAALFANPYQKPWGAPDNAPLPIYGVSLGRVLRGILPFGRPFAFREATERVVNSAADLRWGPDRKGYRRLLHPNGICLTGTLEDHARDRIHRLFPRGQRGIDGGPLFDLLHRAAARP